MDNLFSWLKEFPCIIIIPIYFHIFYYVQIKYFFSRNRLCEIQAFNQVSLTISSENLSKNLTVEEHFCLQRALRRCADLGVGYSSVWQIIAVSEVIRGDYIIIQVSNNVFQDSEEKKALTLLLPPVFT